MSGISLDPSAPLVLEGAAFALMLLVLVMGLIKPGGGSRMAGWLTLAGLAALLTAAFAASPGATALGGSFVLDELALVDVPIHATGVHLQSLARC